MTRRLGRHVSRVGAVKTLSIWDDQGSQLQVSCCRHLMPAPESGSSYGRLLTIGRRSPLITSGTDSGVGSWRGEPKAATCPLSDSGCGGSSRALRSRVVRTAVSISRKPQIIVNVAGKRARDSEQFGDLNMHFNDSEHEGCKPTHETLQID